MEVSHLLVAANMMMRSNHVRLHVNMIPQREMGFFCFHFL